MFTLVEFKESVAGGEPGNCYTSTSYTAAVLEAIGIQCLSAILLIGLVLNAGLEEVEDDFDDDVKTDEGGDYSEHDGDDDE